MIVHPSRDFFSGDEDEDLVQADNVDDDELANDALRLPRSPLSSSHCA